jgi:hypothetical protein
MPTCPNCEKQYLPEIAACPVCGASLKEMTASADTAVEGEPELLELAKFQTMAEADLLKELLESNGIQTVVRGDTVPIGWFELPTILVEKKQFEKATELYDMYFAGESAEIESADADES